VAKRSKAKSPTEHDRYIGQRIREARLASGITQMDLADMLGISYQQLQKYESGDNRVSGARINRLVTALNRPLNYFFPNVTDVRAAPAFGALLATKKGLRLAADFPRLSPHLQDVVVDLVVTLAKEQAHD
jgi:transcriptional regulator with XRE-family HTH domain